MRRFSAQLCEYSPHGYLRPPDLLVYMQSCAYCTGFDLSFHLSQKLAFQHQIWPRYDILRACIACLELGRDASETVVAPCPLEMLRDRGRLYCHLSLNYQAKFVPRKGIVYCFWYTSLTKCENLLCEDSPHSCAKILRTAVQGFSARLFETSWSTSLHAIMCLLHRIWS